jgi:hypothetical protein
VQKYFSGEINVGGLSDPVSLNALWQWREENRDRDGVRQATYGLQPLPWEGIMKRMQRIHEQRPSGTAVQGDSASRSDTETIGWQTLCDTAASSMNTIST